MYQACPGENCNKKVIDQNDGTYRCEKCNRSYQNYKWRMILSVRLDWANLDYIDLIKTCFFLILDQSCRFFGRNLGYLFSRIGWIDLGRRRKWTRFFKGYSMNFCFFLNIIHFHDIYPIFLMKNDSRFDEIFSNCVFQEYNFKLRAKQETYNVNFCL